MKSITKPTELNYSTYKKFIEELLSEYSFISAEIIGKTILSRSIFSFSVGNEDNSVLILSGLSGSDGVSPLLSLTFLQEISSAIHENKKLCGVDIKKVFSKIGLTVVPLLNPDGREIFLYGSSCAKSMKKYIDLIYEDKNNPWCANARGVDLRENFPTNLKAQKDIAEEYKIFFPREEFFSGEFPESEAETKAITRLCRTKSFRQALEIEKGEGKILLSPNDSEIPEGRVMGKLIAESGTIPFYSEESYSFSDYFTNETSRPGFKLYCPEEKSPGSVQKSFKKFKEALTVFTLM